MIFPDFIILRSKFNKIKIIVTLFSFFTRILPIIWFTMIFYGFIGYFRASNLIFVALFLNSITSGRCVLISKKNPEQNISIIDPEEYVFFSKKI